MTNFEKVDFNQVFTLDPKTGHLYWKSRPLESYSSETQYKRWYKLFCGKRAGTVNSKGYIAIHFNHKIYKAHRVVWEMVHGEPPQGQIDHIDRDKTNNSPNNLRVVNTQENCKNQVFRKDNTSGVVGVHWDKVSNKYKSQININKKRVCLGQFNTLEEAINCRTSAEKEYGYTPALKVLGR